MNGRQVHFITVTLLSPSLPQPPHYHPSINHVTAFTLPPSLSIPPLSTFPPLLHHYSHPSIHLSPTSGSLFTKLPGLSQSTLSSSNQVLFTALLLCTSLIQTCTYNPVRKYVRGNNMTSDIYYQWRFLKLELVETTTIFKSLSESKIFPKDFHTVLYPSTILNKARHWSRSPSNVNKTKW